MSVVLAVVLVFYTTVPVSFEIATNEIVQILVSMVALALLGLLVLVEVRHQLLDDDRRIDGLVLALMIAVLGFALGFYVLGASQPRRDHRAQHQGRRALLHDVHAAHGRLRRRARRGTDRSRPGADPDDLQRRHPRDGRLGRSTGGCGLRPRSAPRLGVRNGNPRETWCP